MSTSPEVFKDREAPVAQLEELKRQFERGEIRAASSRLFMADGTWKDIALGDDAQDSHVFGRSLSGRSASFLVDSGRMIINIIIHEVLRNGRAADLRPSALGLCRG